MLLSLKMTYNSKTVGRKVQWSDNLDSWILITYIWDTFDLVLCKVLLESFGALF